MQEPILEFTSKKRAETYYCNTTIKDWKMSKNRDSNKSESIPRKSLFDSLTVHAEKNLYCSLSDLTNEASVRFFCQSAVARFELQRQPKSNPPEISGLMIRD